MCQKTGAARAPFNKMRQLADQLKSELDLAREKHLNQESVRGGVAASARVEVSPSDGGPRTRRRC